MAAESDSEQEKLYMTGVNNLIATNDSRTPSRPGESRYLLGNIEVSTASIMHRIPVDGRFVIPGTWSIFRSVSDEKGQDTIQHETYEQASIP